MKIAILEKHVRQPAVSKVVIVWEATRDLVVGTDVCFQVFRRL